MILPKSIEADMREKLRRLGEQFPKRCGCGCIYVREEERAPDGSRYATDWLSLELAYRLADAFATQEARHCPCGSTIVVLVEIHDLAQE